MLFSIGDKAVYPAQGVGVVEAIETKEFSGEKHDFYVLRICDSDMTIMVPTANVQQVGMRCLVKKEQINEVYDVLQDTDAPIGNISSWSRRQRDYTEKIRSGDLLSVAAVLRELNMISVGKELSYGEKKVLDLARRLVVKEMAFAEDVDEDQICQKVDKVFHH
ncbi:MAG: CarD family transcriptional regulator [Desulfobacteraceae bacterium 4572_35.1]|nr:MAG: CarD family transcriptional regulator [Desulfobacteraceae bacterium 4572_35.1]